ncbi:MAG: hypothetical protein ACRDD8_06045 [Bacteroidales bacterium]
MIEKDMSRAQKKNGTRLTKPAKPQGIGRPKGTLKKRKFEETKVGFFLKYETPDEYDLIVSSITNNDFSAPDAGIIELVAKASKDECFKKKKFWKYLDEYVDNGCFISRPCRMTKEKEVYYRNIRKTSLMAYISKNKSRLNAELVL